MPASSATLRRFTTNAVAQMAATNPGDGSRAYRPYLESRRTTFVSRPSSQGLKPVSRLRGTAPIQENKDSDTNGTALREKPYEIEGFGYEPLTHILPEVL